MINLRHLMLEGCMGLSGMPRGIGELNGVRTLNRFVLSESNCLGRGGSAGLAELGTLNELRGHLEIDKLRHVVSESNVGTPLKDKQHLCSLQLFWKYREDVRGVDEEDIIKSMEVLQPHSNLKQLSVYDYNGVRFASWFSSLRNIVNLELRGCKRCQRLPPLDHLPSLKSLTLAGFDELEYISENESSKSMSDEMMRISFFPSLEELSIVYCPVLKGWWRAHTHNSASSSSSTENLSLPSFTRLSTLEIYNCPNLTSLPLYPNVERIELTRSSWKVVDSLFVRGASDITHDVGVDVSASSSSPHPSKLTHLSLHEIEDLASLPEEISNLTSLQGLGITNCSNLSSLPEGIICLPLRSLYLTALEKLEYISENESSNSMSDEMMRISSFPSLEYLYIADCPVLKGWWRAHTHNSASSSSSTENLSLPSFTRLSTLQIYNCPNLSSMPLYPNVERIELGRSSWKVVDSLFVRGASDITHDVGVDVSASSSSPHLSKLTYLKLEGIEDLASLPEEINNLTSLQHLQISNCSNLSSLPEGIICLPLRALTLTALEKLEYISENESSNSMSDEMMRISFFPSLEYLSIEDCPVLKGWWRAHTHNSASSSSSTENLLLPSFPRLSILSIDGCPNLTSMPLYPNVERTGLRLLTSHTFTLIKSYMQRMRRQPFGFNM